MRNPFLRDTVPALFFLFLLCFQLSPIAPQTNMQTMTTSVRTTQQTTSTTTSRRVARETRILIYNKSLGYLNNIQVISHDPAMIQLSLLPTYEIYRTTHWIWFCDPTWYGSNRQYVDPFLDWPETCYLKIAEWLSLVLPPGGFEGGRRGVYVDPAPGFWAWAGGGNIGVGRDVFVSLPSWADVVIPHETTNMFTAEGVCGGWPTDWWANSRSPFPAMVAVKVEAFYNKPYWQQHDADDSTDPTYVMFKNLQSTYGWSLFQETFKDMNSNNVDLSQIRSEFESPQWLSLGYLKSHYVAHYLCRAAERLERTTGSITIVDLSSTLNAATVGKRPSGYTGTFYEYAISLASVRPIADIQSPVGWQHGTITLHATASDPDQHIVDVTFWYSRDRSVFSLIGMDQDGSDGWSVQWNTANPIPDVDESVSVMCVSHDTNRFESGWSVSDQFGVDNGFFSLSSSGGITVAQGGSGSNTITVTLISGATQSVSLSASGLPSGATASLNPVSGNPTFTSTCTISTSSSTPTGACTIAVIGTGGGLTRNTTFTLTVKLTVTRIILDATPKPGYVNKLVTISGTMYGSWRRIRGVVVGASVEITTNWGLRTSAVTDDQGQFSVTATCPSAGGTYTITATFYEDEDLTRSSTTIQYEVIAKIATSVTISYSYGGDGLIVRFSGTLRDMSGNPLANKEVALITWHRGKRASLDRTTMTDGNGGWSIACSYLNWDTARIEFRGDETYLPCSATVTKT